MFGSDAGIANGIADAEKVRVVCARSERPEDARALRPLKAKRWTCRGEITAKIDIEIIRRAECARLRHALPPDIERMEDERERGADNHSRHGNGNQ